MTTSYRADDHQADDHQADDHQADDHPADDHQADDHQADDRQRDERGVDAQFRTLLEGLRTSLPGVQVLFAFLLTAPFQSGFDDLGGAERVAFSVAFFASAAASILLIAPSVHQRLRAPSTGIPRQSERHLVLTIWMTIAGTVAMGLAMLATAYLVSAIVFGQATAAVATTMVMAILAWGWFYLPLVTFARIGDSTHPPR